jgi:hypothetical protein
MNDKSEDDAELLALGRRFEPLYFEWCQLWREFKNASDEDAKKAEDSCRHLNQVLTLKANEILSYQPKTAAGFVLHLRAMTMFHTPAEWDEEGDETIPYIGAFMRSACAFFGVDYPK